MKPMFSEGDKATLLSSPSHNKAYEPWVGKAVIIETVRPRFHWSSTYGPMYIITLPPLYTDVLCYESRLAPFQRQYKITITRKGEQICNPKTTSK